MKFNVQNLKTGKNVKKECYFYDGVKFVLDKVYKHGWTIELKQRDNGVWYCGLWVVDPKEDWYTDENTKQYSSENTNPCTASNEVWEKIGNDVKKFGFDLLQIKQTIV